MQVLETSINEQLSLQDNITKPIQAIAYCRFSSDMQREESISAQKRAISYYAKENNIEIIRFYEDRALSGKNTQRPAYQEMILYLKSGKVKAIMCHKIDRLSRNMADIVNLTQFLSDNDIKLISVSEKLDDSPAGKLMLYILSAINSMYIDNLSAEITKGMTENAYQAISTGGKPPLGYDIVDKKYVINTYEAEAIKIIFNMYDEGFGYNKIINKLNSLGYKTKMNNCFGKNSLWAIFKNERYKGVYVYNKAPKRKSNGSRSGKKKPDNEIIRVMDGVPAIVSDDLWQRVNDKLNTNKSISGSYKAKEIYLLSGLIRCGCCGYAMHGNARHPSKTRDKFISYRCNHRDNNLACNNREIKRDEIEDFVISQLEQHLFNNSIIPELTKQLNQYIKDSTKNSNSYMAQYQKCLSELESQKLNIINAISMSGYADVFSDKLLDIENKIRDVKYNISVLEVEKPPIHITEDKIRSYLGSFNELIKSRDISKIKNFINSYIERVDVYQDSVKVTMKVAFAFVGDNRQYSFEVDTHRDTIKTA